MIYLTIAQKIYLAVAISGGFLILALVFALLYYHVFRNKHIKYLVYKELYSLANLNDYLLLNNYRINFDKTHYGIVDHILITNKYILLINDFNLSGVLKGEFTDAELNQTTNKGSKKIINPLNLNVNLTKRVILMNDLDPSLVKGVVVVNNDAHVEISNMPNNYRFIKRNELSKFIKDVDKEKVKNLREEQVVKFINFLNEYNPNKESK